MAIVSKNVDRAIPRPSRNQYFTEADVSVGDVLDIKTTLGGIAREIRINPTGGDMTVRLNCLTTVFKNRDQGGPTDDLSFINAGLPNLTSGHTLVNSGVTPLLVKNGTALVIDTMGVNDVQIVSAAGAWNIFVY